MRCALLVAVGALPLALGACGGGDGGPRHNVLLVTLDTTRADHLGCYGGSAETPHIDALAEEGALFSRAMSTAGLTPMSHASILTGLNNYRHGLRVFYSEKASYQLSGSVPTLAEILGGSGWRTAAFVSAYPVSQFYGLDRGFEEYDVGVDVDSLTLDRQQKHDTLWFEGEKSATQRRGDYTVSAALEWLEACPEGTPWCLWVHLFDVHDFSIVPDSEWIARFGIEYDKQVRVTDADWRVKMYDPELSFADEQVGRLLAHLRETGQWDNTIVVVTADHGQGLQDGYERHGWLKHRLLYDWSLHVPLVMRVPGEAPAVVEPLVRTIDVLPTLLELLDLPAPSVEGESLLTLMRGGPDDGRVAYADALNLLDAHAPKKMRPEYLDNLYCLVHGRWKLIWHETNEENVELYDLHADPLEMANVAAEHPGEVQRLKAMLDERRAMDVRPPEAGGAAPDTATLKALGYTGDDEDEEAGGHEDC